MTNLISVGGCPFEEIGQFGIQWPSSVPNDNVTVNCSSGFGN